MRGRILVGLIALVLPAAALAAEGGGAGMPQLDATKFAPQLIWLAIAFVVLYVLMAKVALPRVSEVLEARADHINDDLRRAEQAREEAESVMLAYEKALADARAKAQAEAKTATDAVQAMAQQRSGEAGAALAAELAASERQIAEARTAALANVGEIATEVAGDAVRRIAGIQVDPGAVRAAVQAAGGR
ncbi:MAG: F0F1 ATP synthase subunit B' [Alphaproteobacteria bacterium]